MSKWIDFSIDERKAMIQGVVEAKNIDEAAAEKDWWVTAILLVGNSHIVRLVPHKGFRVSTFQRRYKFE